MREEFCVSLLLRKGFSKSAGVMCFRRGSATKQLGLVHFPKVLTTECLDIDASPPLLFPRTISVPGISSNPSLWQTSVLRQEDLWGGGGEQE